MENASDALKMAAAMLIFAGALTITIFMFSKARQASSSIMAQADKNKTFYNIENPVSERIVGINDVISNLYSYYQTQNTILFYTGRMNGTILESNSIEKMPLYVTKADDKTLKKSTLTLNDKGVSNQIYGVDINDEAIREEQWVNAEERRKQFVDFLINKKDIPKDFFSTTKDRSIQFTYSIAGRSFMESENARFVERIGEYNKDLETSETTNETDEGDIIGQFNGLSVDSSIIRFSETDETIDNSKGDKKKVIQYIYLREN